MGAFHGMRVALLHEFRRRGGRIFLFSTMDARRSLKLR